MVKKSARHVEEEEEVEIEEEEDDEIDEEEIEDEEEEDGEIEDEEEEDGEIDEDDEEEEEPPPKKVYKKTVKARPVPEKDVPKKRKVKVDPGEVIDKFQVLYDVIDCEIANKREGTPVPIGKLKNMKTQVKDLEKDFKKVVKGPKVTRKTNNMNSGFNKEYIVDPKLVKFMGLRSGTKVNRVSAQQALCGYIRENNLKNSDTPKVFRLDKNLAILLKGKVGEEITYPILIKRMQGLFPAKTEAPKPVARKTVSVSSKKITTKPAVKRQVKVVRK